MTDQTAEICGADPLVRSRRPRRPSPLFTILNRLDEQRDQGVARGRGRPPHKLMQDSSFWENYAALARISHR